MQAYTNGTRTWKISGNKVEITNSKGETNTHQINRLPDCIHLGSPIPDDKVTISALCPGCTGKLQWNTTTHQVHQCSMFVRCLPTYRCAKTAVDEKTVSGDDSAVACSQCEYNPANQKRVTEP